MTRNLVQARHDARAAALPYASARWLASRGLHAPGGERWKVTIGLDCANPRAVPAAAAATSARLQIVIESFEWSLVFRQGTRSSSIRVTDAPRVHERDDFGLLPHVTELRGLGTFVRWLEQRFQIQFRRPHATIDTNLVDAQQTLLLWVVSAL